MRLFIVFSIIFALLPLHVFGAPKTIQISNVAKCASESALPTDTVFLSISAENVGRLSSAIAESKGFQKAEFIDKAIRAYQNRILNLSLRILSALKQKTLPLIQQSEEDRSLIEKFRECKNGLSCDNYKNIMQGRFDFAKISSAYDRESQISCVSVDKFSSLQADLFLHEISADNLTALAKSYFEDLKTTRSCTEQLSSQQVNTYFLATLNLNPTSSGEFQKNGFAFWTSFKIYLSAAWRYVDLPTDELLFRKIFRSIAFEEDLILIPNGCKSILAPSCDSNSLTATNIRELANQLHETDPIPINSEELRTRTFQPDNSSDVIEASIANSIEDNKWLVKLHKSLRAFSWGLATEFRGTQEFFQTLMIQKGVARLIEDLNQQLDKLNGMGYQAEAELIPFYDMCLENNLLGDARFSFYRFDLNSLDKISAMALTRRYDLIKPAEIVNVYNEFNSKLKPICDRVNELVTKKGFKNKSMQTHRPWFKRYLQQYLKKELSSQQETPSETVSNTASTGVTANSLNAYLKLSSNSTIDPDYVFCPSPVECARTVIESVAQLNRIALNSKAFLSNDVTDVPIFNRGSDKVACGLFNPWEHSEQAHKKLFYDLLSSAVFSYTFLPIYIDVNYKPRELVSFQKLVADGTIKFDTKYDVNKLNTILIANFGNLLGAPCQISISQTEKAQMPNPLFGFKGISVGACSADNHNKVDLSGAKILGDSFKNMKDDDLTKCGQCSINFEPITYNTSKQFAPLRFILRLLNGFFIFNRSMQDPSVPKTEEVNLDFLVETYKKFNSIPKFCVKPLSNGQPCLQDSENEFPTARTSNEL